MTERHPVDPRSGAIVPIAAEDVWPFVPTPPSGPPRPDPRVTARIAAGILGCPTAQLTCIYPADPVFRFARSTRLNGDTFAHAVILRRERQIVSDATKDERFAGLLQVALYPKARFLAGFPLFSPAGILCGALTLMDYAPHPPPDRRLVGQVEHLAELISFNLGF